MTKKQDPQNTLIDRYVRCAGWLRRAVYGLAEIELDLCESSGSWTIREYVHHVVDGDDAWTLCIKQALGNPDLPFTLDWYIQYAEQEHWSRAWRYAGRGIGPSLALLRANRAHVAQLMRAIPDSLDTQVTVRGRDGSLEVARIRDVVEMLIRHVEGHIADIERIREKWALRRT